MENNSGAAEQGGQRPGGSNAIADYEMRLRLLEQQNRRLMMTRQEQDAVCATIDGSERAPGSCDGQPAVGSIVGQPSVENIHAQAPATNLYALQNYQMQLMLLEQQNKKRLMLARQELDAQHQVTVVDYSKDECPDGKGPEPNNHALQGYQSQLMLLEQQNKRRHMMARQGQDDQLVTAVDRPKDERPDSTTFQDLLQDFRSSLPPLESQNKGKEVMPSQQDRPRNFRSDVNIREFDVISIDLEIQKIRTATVCPITSKYPARAHAHKVKIELNVTSGLIYLVGQKDKQWEDTDGEMPFRQRRYAFYLSGADFSGTAVTYDIAKDELILWVPVRAPAQELWTGTIPSIEECKAKFDVDSVRDISEIKSYLSKVLDPQNKPPPAYILHKAERPPQLDWERSGGGPSLEPDVRLLMPAMARARAVKTPYEVAQIRKAVDISSQAHLEVLKHIKYLQNEAQVESIFLSKCRELGAKNQAYPPIAGSGPNAAVLHYDANDQDFGDRQLLVLDAGAEFKCYASDVTRTFPLSGTFTNEAKRVYQIVLNMQNECIDMIRPGQLWSKVTSKALDIAMQGLLNAGILQSGHSGQAPSFRAVTPFFPHGLGHLVGLDTHDVISEVGVHNSAPSPRGSCGLFRGKRQSRDSMVDNAVPLVEGMVITCEPGLYFNRAYIEDILLKEPELAQYINKSLLEEYYPVGGCRLEDCVLVTRDGFENLTTAPKGRAMMKIINGKT